MNQKTFWVNLDGDNISDTKPENVEGLNNTWIEVIPVDEIIRDIKQEEFFHVTSIKNLNSILSEGLKKNTQGRINLTKNPHKWERLHKDSIIFKVKVPSYIKIKEQNDNDAYCLTNILSENITLYNYKSEKKIKFKSKLPSLTEYIDKQSGRITEKDIVEAK